MPRYNNPAVSGLMIDPELTQRLSKIENIVALKDNSPNAADYALKAALIDPDDMVLLNGLGSFIISDQPHADHIIGD